MHALRSFGFSTLRAAGKRERQRCIQSAAQRVEHVNTTEGFMQIDRSAVASVWQTTSYHYAPLNMEFMRLIKLIDTDIKLLLRHILLGVSAFIFFAIPSFAQNISGKLLATSGVTQVEGAAGGGLAVWSVIGGYGTEDQIGGSAFATFVSLNDYRLRSTGAALGIYDRVELSFAQQAFDTRDVGAALGLGRGYTFKQDVFGAKVRLIGDAVYDQDRLLPQIAVGVQHKRNKNGNVLAALGIPHATGTDVYVSATKLFIDQRLLASLAVRFTKTNQLGILGFGGPNGDSLKPQLEGSLAFLVRRDLAFGVEGRSKRDFIGLNERAAWDVFIAWFPTKNASLTLAYVDLGPIVIPGRQRGTYASLQLSF
jgi:Protein of unknown function (DUF3034)